LQVYFGDGTCTERVEISYPIGHRRRRAEGIPVLVQKFRKAIAAQYGADQAGLIEASLGGQADLEAMPVTDFVARWVT
jgi:2-methylcitrate dehydratase